MELKKLICSCCGGELIVKDDAHYLCRYCKALYEKDNAEEVQEALSNILEQDKLERLSSARKALFDAMHAKYPSEKVVINAANNVLSINPDDPLALAVLYSHDESANELSRVLPDMKVDINTANEICDWMMRNISPRQVTPLSDFVQRHYQGKELTDRLTKLEDEMEKLEQGYYLSNAPRDVFLCYSSSDMPEVIRTINALESNGFYCFSAFRNLRHGRGAKENYLKEIEQAIQACKVFVFISTKNSRSVYCDAIRVELPYLTKLADKERVEYMIDNDDKNTPLLVKKLLKEAFPTQERVNDEESLILRVDSLIKEMNNPKKSQVEIGFEESNKKVSEEKTKEIQEMDEKRIKKLFDIEGTILNKYKGQDSEVRIPSFITKIGFRAFENCKSLTSIVIPDSVVSIDQQAFDGCESLKSLTLPDSITSIEYASFSGCKSLKSITFPKSLKTIEMDAFWSCKSLTLITFPNGILSIGIDAFENCESLTSIVIPDSIKSIDHGAFENCKSLKSLTLPNSLNSIGVNAFRGCESLETVYSDNPDRIKKLVGIGRGVFKNTRVKKTLFGYEIKQS